MVTSELKVSIYDIECMCSMFLYCCYIPHQDKKYSFEISTRKNQLDEMIKHLKEEDYEFGVGYNNVNYDSQVIQYILESHEDWYDKSTFQIIKLIYQFSKDTIERSNYEQKPIYRENYLDIKQIDLFRVHHYDNKNRRVGLKTLEFAMDLPNIEEMPVDWRKECLTDEEIQTVVDYCWNDVEATYKFWKITIGDTDNELYKGKDMIQARLDIMEELKFNYTVLNYSDVKIGDEINKKGYMQETGCNYDDIYQKRQKRKPTPAFTFGNCIPKYVKFKSKQFNDLLKQVKNEKVTMTKGDQEYIVTYGNTTYSIMRGGIHSHDSARIVESTDTYILRDADIGSQYPNAINKRKLYPSHLGPEWNRNYEKTIYKRIEYKKMGKTERKYAGLAEAYKLALNGGGYGKTNEASNWQYDPQVMYMCTIGNQFEILMLIEWLEDVGISVISANTDGIVSYIPRPLEDKYYEICKEWEVVVGNDKIGQLEYCDYQKLVQRDVNNYIAIKPNGEIKTKGVFEIDKLLHKNKSNKVRAKGLTAWYKDGISPEDYIKTNRNIYDYTIGKKASRDYSYQGIDRNTGETSEYDQIVRYIVSKSGERLYKVKNPDSDKKGRAFSKCEAKSEHQKLLNRISEDTKWEEYDLDEQYYIDEIWKIIETIQPEYISINKNKKTGQISLF